MVARPGMDNTIELLTRYCVNQGAIISDAINVKFDSTYSGFGVFVGETSINKGDVVMSIPFDICISYQTAINHKPLQIIFDENPSLLDYPDEILSIAILYAKVHENEEMVSEICPWSLHVKTFPKTFNTPLYWSDDELEQLKPCTIYHLVKMMNRQILSDWEAIQKPLSLRYSHLLGSVDFELYKWSLSVIYSRAVGIERNGEYIRCVPPLLDMANHYHDGAESTDETINFDSRNDSVQLISNSIVDASNQIYAYYGPYCNAKLLYNYGFVVHNNRNRSVDLWAKVQPNSFQAKWKQDMLDSHSLTSLQTYDFKGTIRPNHISPALLATIRIIQVADENEMKNAENAFVGKPISHRNEIASYTALRGLIVGRMKIQDAEVRLLQFFPVDIPWVFHGISLFPFTERILYIFL